MEKVKLTQEQAGEIERIKNYFNRHEYITKFVETNGVSDSEFHIEELVRALYIGYEVEPEFKVGAWVSVSWQSKKPTIHKDVKLVGGNDLKIDGEQLNKHPSLDIVRHATPKEIAKEKQRRWWAKHDRGLWELAPGDIVFFPGRIYREVTSSVNDCRRGEYTFDDSFDVYKNELINGSYEVVCFAKDRKDA